MKNKDGKNKMQTQGGLGQVWGFEGAIWPTKLQAYLDFWSWLHIALTWSMVSSIS